MRDHTHPRDPIHFRLPRSRADAAHADATNNIGAVLTTLSPENCKQVIEHLGLMPPTLEKDKYPAWSGEGNGTAEINVDAVDAIIEGLFRRALELENSHRWALNNLGLHLHLHGRNNEVGNVMTSGGQRRNEYTVELD